MQRGGIIVAPRNNVVCLRGGKSVKLVEIREGTSVGFDRTSHNLGRAPHSRRVCVLVSIQIKRARCAVSDVYVNISLTPQGCVAYLLPRIPGRNFFG